jgi:acetolactate synthase regulatory subunit
MQPITALLAHTDDLVVPAYETAPPPDTRHRFALEVEDAPEALERVLAQLRRRRCRVLDVAFAAPLVPGDAANLIVEVEPPEARAHLVEHWLTGIHAVHACEAIGG